MMKAYKAICTKEDTVISRTVRTKHEIYPGDLLKEMIVKKQDTSEYCVIKIYERETKGFHNDFYECNPTSIKRVDENIWSQLSELKPEVNITLNFKILDSKAKVNFCIKHIGDVPNQDAGRFVILELINSPDHTEELKLYLKKYNYYQSGRYIIKVHKLVEYLSDSDDEVEQIPLTQNNFEPHSPKTISKANVVDCYARNQGANEIISNGNQMTMDCNEFQVRSEITEPLYNFKNQEENGMNEYARQDPRDFLKTSSVELPQNTYFPNNDTNSKQVIKDFCGPLIGATTAKDFLRNSNDSSNIILFYCKQCECNGIWFVNKKAGKNKYCCPICDKYNCLCEVIHSGMTCEAYQQRSGAV